MNSIKIILSLIALWLACSCTPKVTGKLRVKHYEPLPETTFVHVLNQHEEVPANSEYIGKIKVGDPGFTRDCMYDKILKLAKEGTLYSGANVLKITKVKQPNPMGSACYRLLGKIYRNLDTNSLQAMDSNRIWRNKSSLPENADYAIIHFYRPQRYIGTLLGYKIKTSRDSIIGRVRDGEYFDFKTKNFGRHTFYGELETKVGVALNIKKGEEYFIRCGVKMGIAYGRPEMALIENYVGRKELEKMK